MTFLENNGINTHPLKFEIRNTEIYMVQKKKIKSVQDTADITDLALYLIYTGEKDRIN